jgi:hypothetical protein
MDKGGVRSRLEERTDQGTFPDTCLTSDQDDLAAGLADTAEKLGEETKLSLPLQYHSAKLPRPGVLVSIWLSPMSPS